MQSHLAVIQQSLHCLCFSTVCHSSNIKGGALSFRVSNLQKRNRGPLMHLSHPLSDPPGPEQDAPLTAPNQHTHTLNIPSQNSPAATAPVLLPSYQVSRALMWTIQRAEANFIGVCVKLERSKYTHIYIYIYTSGGPLSALTWDSYRAIKKISPLIYSQSWVGSWVYTTQAMMTFTLIF